MKSYFGSVSISKSFFDSSMDKTVVSIKNDIYNIQQQLINMDSEITTIKNYVGMFIQKTNLFIYTNVKTGVKLHYVKYIMKYGVPDDGIFDLDKLNEFTDE